MTLWILGNMYYIIYIYIMFILWLVWWLLGIFTYASSSSWRLIGNCEECLSSTPSVEACTYLELSLTYVPPPPVHDFRLIDYVILLLLFSYWVIDIIIEPLNIHHNPQSSHNHTWTRSLKVHTLTLVSRVRSCLGNLKDTGK